MPVDPKYQHADIAHEKTVVDSGYRYGCNGVEFKPQRDQYNQDGWSAGGIMRRIVLYTTNWKPDPAGKACGHLDSASDPACEGCPRR